MNPFGSLENLVRQGEPLAMHTWFQLGGPAEYFAEPSNTDQLIALVRRCFEEDVPLRILGRGSNVLVRDEGVPGLVLRLIEPAFSEIRTGDQTITAGAGAARPRRDNRGSRRPDRSGIARRRPRNPRRGRVETPARMAATSANGPPK